MLFDSKRQSIKLTNYCQKEYEKRRKNVTAAIEKYQVISNYHLFFKTKHRKHFKNGMTHFQKRIEY